MEKVVMSLLGLLPLKKYDLVSSIGLSLDLYVPSQKNFKKLLVLMKFKVQKEAVKHEK